MAPKFRVPKCLEDFMEPPNDDDDTLYARDIVDIDSLDSTEMHHLVASEEHRNLVGLCHERKLYKHCVPASFHIVADTSFGV